ncbi:glycerate kinase [Comamonas odontotermitis]|uniref:glycerate kinase n=1 Tax=Comamonas odontotermitis TaxID=379895 RepID=UPI001CC7E54A|nr:glycerate kinase [Comamonas odontotermitis]UBB17385.1 glycerate kinase [Comamonas odontotermitis]
MNWRNILIPIGLLVLLGAAYQNYKWMGVLAVGGGIVMWLMLHFTRLMTIMKRASERPLGYVASAVMLNAKLKPQMPLVHVVAMTRSLGLRQSKDLEQPEVFVWRDNTDSTVTCEFVGGRLRTWTLERPAVAEPAPIAGPGNLN